MWPDYVESPCRANYTYFWSAEYMRTAYHCTAIFTLPLSLFTFYVIWKVTPPKMSNMKWPLLISQFWSTNLDLMFTVFIEPVLFYPSNSGLTMGVFDKMGMGTKWQGYCGQVSIMMMGIGFICLFENRHSQIATTNFKLKTPLARGIYFGINYLIAFTIILPFYLTPTDQIKYRQSVLRMIPCPTIEFYDSRTYVLLTHDGEIDLYFFFSITIATSGVLFQGLFFVIHTLMHLFKVDTCKVSQATKTLQRKFLNCVVMQFSIPTIAILIPIVYECIAHELKYFNQAINNNAMLFMTNHGLIATSCTLFIYKPYRDFIKHAVFRRPVMVTPVLDASKI